MAEKLTLEVLNNAVQNAAALRCRRILQPAGGTGTKVFPPTYAGAVYAREKRRLPGRDDPVECVVIDSVQSQANRMEEALQEALDSGKIAIPVVEVDFSDATSQLIEPIGRLTSLQVPHRISDAILRDTTLDGVKFRESEWGRKLNTAGCANATPVYQICPTALIFGMWDSTGPKGGLGMKIERAVVSEIVAQGVEYAEKNRGVRRDPLEIRSGVPLQGGSTDWKLAAGAGGKNTFKPSEINHGSVPFDSDNAGVTFESAEQHTTLSLIALRRLRFPVAGNASRPTDQAAQTVLAALAIFAAASAAEKGLDLRSRCLLWPDGPMVWELLEKPGEAPRKFVITGEAAAALLNEAVSAAKAAGLAWLDKPLVLKPLSQLVDLVRQSQAATAASGAEQEKA